MTLGKGERAEQSIERLDGASGTGLVGGIPMPAHSLECCEGATQSQEGARVGTPACLACPPTDADPYRSPSLMSGLASLDAKTSSRLGILTVAYYLWTTFVAVIVGIVMVSIIHPGSAAQKETTEHSGKPIMSSADPLLDLIR